MVNEIRNDEPNLVNVNYTSLLATIITVLQNQTTENPFRVVAEGKRLIVQLSAIAQSVAASSIDNPLGNKSNQAKVATVNFSSGSKAYFTQQVQQIRQSLKLYLEQTLSQQDPSPSVEEWVNSLATELIDFTGNLEKKLSFSYPFQKPVTGLQKSKLTFQQDQAYHRHLKFHKLKLTINNARQFREQLQRSLENYIELQFTEDEQIDLKDILTDLQEYDQSDFYRLENLMDTEVLGKLQREAKVVYLEFLQEQIGSHRDIIYLEDLIRRLRLIEDYINNEEKEDGHYDVNYQEIPVNYRDLFSRADAFDMLPVIPIIEGCLGETEDNQNGKQQFIFGLKLKFNGPVQTEGGKKAFDYYLELLDSKSNEHQQGLANLSSKKFFVEKVLKIALLYYFVFAETPNTDPLESNPITNFEAKVLPTLQGDDEESKQTLLRGIKRGLENYQAGQKVERLEKLLKTFIQSKHNLPTRNYPRHINVKQGILEKDYQTINNNNSFFRSLETPKSALKYLSITHPNTGNTSLSTITANISISEVSYFSAGEPETFSMEYNFGKVPTLPMLLTPEEEKCREIYKEGLNQYNLLIFSYDPKQLNSAILKDESSAKRFIYKVSFSLLVYTTLKMLLDSAAKPFFIPILRFHLGDHQNPYPEEKFLKSVFSVVSQGKRILIMPPNLV